MIVCFSLLLLTSHLSSAAASFLLTTSSSKVQVGFTKHVTLDCSYWGDGGSSPIQNVTEITIFRINNESLEVVEKFSDAFSTPTPGGHDATRVVTGKIGPLVETFLKIVWPIATGDTPGSYRCDVSGDSNPSVEHSPEVSIQEADVTLSDVVAFLTQESTEVREFCTNLVHTTDGNIRLKLEEAGQNLTNEITAVEERFGLELQQLRENQTAEIRQLRADLEALSGGTVSNNSTCNCDKFQNDLEQLKTRLDYVRILQYWPEGTYGLLMPETGCPLNGGAVWDTGYRKFHTESTTTNLDFVEPDSHLKTPIKERNETNNFVYLHFCVSSNRSLGPPWPPGSYCIHSVGQCPSGSNQGYVYATSEHTHPASTKSGHLPTMNAGLDYTQTFFCCRSDGPASEPVYLPTARPFYLYRYKGECQRVEGMSVSSERLVLDTDDVNTDVFQNQFHPDGDINNWEIELCYYQ
ncbi:uncharacterized protein LOC131954399 [Physella acuta]|uniref:uncharacterized protein LOC131954399 n=1 Tax=Physella acuta TaxID=109671 RepID=UPI0027DE8D16|nr:uncharacterized protein LOC131954399 [Physella acuta]